MTGTIEAIRKAGVQPDAIPLFLHTGNIFGRMASRELF